MEKEINDFREEFYKKFPNVKIDFKIVEDKKKYMVEWYKANKDKHLSKLREKNKCECGDMVSYSNKVRHLKTSKHLKRFSLVNKENNDKINMS
jgi:hypothetical protein